MLRALPRRARVPVPGTAGLRSGAMILAVCRTGAGLVGARRLSFTPALRTAPERYPTGPLQHVPIEMIDQVLPIVCEDDWVLCAGGDDVLLGHPVEYIKLDSPAPAECKYCGIRYINYDQAQKSPDWSFLVEGSVTPGH